MGHMSSKDAYRKLGNKIDKLTARTPWSETLHEILKELYSAEEADVVVKMPFGLSSLRKIARTTKYDESKLRTILEGLADKGLVVDLHRGEKAYYLPSPMVIGIFEFTMMRTDANLDRKKISGLFHEYLKGDNRFYAANGFDNQLVSVLRTLPYQESVIPDQHVEVLDFEKPRRSFKATRDFRSASVPAGTKRSISAAGSAPRRSRPVSRSAVRSIISSGAASRVSPRKKKYSTSSPAQRQKGWSSPPITSRRTRSICAIAAAAAATISRGSGTGGSRMSSSRRTSRQRSRTVCATVAACARRPALSARSKWKAACTASTSSKSSRG